MYRNRQICNRKEKKIINKNISKGFKEIARRLKEDMTVFGHMEF